MIWGEEDTEVTRKDIEDLQRLIPSVQLTAIPNKTHGLIGEAPLVVADFIQAIVKSV